MAVGSEAGAEEAEHFLAGEFLDVRKRFAFDLLHEHRGGRLADAAAVAGKPGFADAAGAVDIQFHAHDVAAERIVVLVGMGASLSVPAVVGLFIMVENPLLVELVLIAGHEAILRWRSAVSNGRDRSSDGSASSAPRD